MHVFVRKILFFFLGYFFIRYKCINNLNIFTIKKLLCIALFSVTIIANANNKKEIVISNFKEGKIEKAVQLNAIAVTKFNEALSQNALVILAVVVIEVLFMKV